MKNIFIIFIVLSLTCPLFAQENNGYKSSISASLLPPQITTDVLNKFLGVPFRADGALDQDGHWVSFNQPDIILSSPGFNCSGFTVAAARELLNYNFSLKESTFDRRGDSGPGAKLGQDWDFGLDLILNLADKYPHRYLPEPENFSESPFIPLSSNRSLGWGINIHSPELENLIAEIKPGSICFFVFSKPDGRFPAGVSYYHVGVIVPEGQSRWLYHTTLGAKTNRIDLGQTAGMARLRRDFKPLKFGERRIFIIEIGPVK